MRTILPALRAGHADRRVQLGAAGQHLKHRGSLNAPEAGRAQAHHRLAERHAVLIALHTDHCQPKKVDGFLRPLIAETARRRKAGLPNLFQSHMLDASELPLAENMKLSQALLAI